MSEMGEEFAEELATDLAEDLGLGKRVRFMRRFQLFANTTYFTVRTGVVLNRGKGEKEQFLCQKLGYKECRDVFYANFTQSVLSDIFSTHSYRIGSGINVKNVDESVGIRHLPIGLP